MKIVGFGTVAYDTINNFLADARAQVVAVAGSCGKRMLLSSEPAKTSFLHSPPIT